MAYGRATPRVVRWRFTLVEIRMRFLNSIAFGLMLVTASASAFATDGPETANGIVQSQRELRSKLDAPSGEYSRFEPADVLRLRQAQDRIFALLGGITSLDQLDDAKKAQLAADLEAVRSIVAANAGNRLVCHREARIGTNITEKRCETVATREARARQSQQDVNSLAGRGRYSDH